MVWYTHKPIAKARFPGRNSEGLRSWIVEINNRMDVGMMNEQEKRLMINR